MLAGTIMLELNSDYVVACAFPEDELPAMTHNRCLHHDTVTDYEVSSFPRLPRPADLDGELLVYCEIRVPFIRDGVDCHPGGLKCAGCKGFAGIAE